MIKKILLVLCISLMVFSPFSYAEEIPPNTPAVEETIAAVEETPAPIERYVSFHFSWDKDEVHYGDKITLVPDLKGFDALNYQLIWQYSTDNSNWMDWSSNSYIINEKNVTWYWRLMVLIME